MKEWDRKQIPRHYPATVKATKMEGPHGEMMEYIALYMGKGQIPHAYTRVKLSMKDIVRGRRATLPWRRIWSTK